MKKNKVLQTLLSLILLGFVGKGLSMIARIMMTRSLGVDAMSLYTLVNPAMVLVITLAQMGLPTTIATLISKHPDKSKKIFISGLLIAILVSIVLMIVLLGIAPFLAKNVLKNEQVTMTIYGLALLIPLVSLSSLLKGYFIGHNQVRQTAFSSIAEEVARIAFILFFLDHFTRIDVEYAAFGAMLGVCVGEIFQTLYLLFQRERRLYLRIREIFAWKEVHPIEEIPHILSLSLPITFARIVGSLTYFFEPIIMTNILVHQGLTSFEITRQYGILNGYAMPVLMLPGFFSLALANFLLPNMASAIGKKDYAKAQKLFLSIMLFSGGIGLAMALIFYFKSAWLLQLLYGTSEGSELVKWLAFPFILYYWETPIANAMHALGLTKKAFITTLLACLLRLLSLALLLSHLEVKAVALSTLLAVFLTIAVNLFHVLRQFARHRKESVIST